MRKAGLIVCLVALSSGVAALLFINRSRLGAEGRRTGLPATNVVVVEASRKPVNRSLEVVGVFQPVNEVAIVSETQGKILACYANIGDRLKAGDPIVKVDTLLKYAAHIAAETAYEKAAADYRRSQALHEENNLADNELEAAHLAMMAAESQYLMAKRQHEDAIIRAPINGVLAVRPADVGMMVSPGMVVGIVVDISRLKATVQVGEKDVISCTKGDPVTVRSTVYEGVEFSGKITSVGPKAGESLQFPVEVTMENSRRHPLRAGMTARVMFKNSVEIPVLLIPRIALLGSVKEGKVYVMEAGIVHSQKVTVGRSFGSDIEILEGLREGQQVVTSGRHNIRDGSAVSTSKF